MRSVGFNRTTRIYVASGMLTYGASGELPDLPEPPAARTALARPRSCRCVPTPAPCQCAAEMDRTKNYLMHTGVCSRVHHKEQYIPQEELEGERAKLRGAPARTPTYRAPGCVMQP